MEIHILNWDTENFGFKIGYIEINNCDNLLVEQLKKDAKKENFKLIYLKSPSLLNNISLFFDEKLVYSKNQEKINEFSCPEIESYRNTSIIESEIYDLALKSGEYSRYKLDNNFPVDCFRVLYKKWIENSIYTDFATDVLVYKIKNKPVGLLTYKHEEDKSNIGIISVNQEFQGCGIGSKLIKYYHSLLKNKVKVFDVVTQGVNNPAKSFYEKNGYKLTSRTYIYHLWI